MKEMFKSYWKVIKSCEIKRDLVKKVWYVKAEAMALLFQKWLEPSLLLLLSSSNFVVVNVFLLTLEVLFSKHINEVLLNE